MSQGYKQSEWYTSRLVWIIVGLISLSLGLARPALAAGPEDRVREILAAMAAVLHDPRLQGAEHQLERTQQVRRLIVDAFDVVPDRSCSRPDFVLPVVKNITLMTEANSSHSRPKTRVQRVDRHGSSKTAIFIAANSIITARHANASVWPALTSASLPTSSAH